MSRGRLVVRILDILLALALLAFVSAGVFMLSMRLKGQADYADSLDYLRQWVIYHAASTQDLMSRNAPGDRADEPTPEISDEAEDAESESQSDTPDNDEETESIPNSDAEIEDMDEGEGPLNFFELKERGEEVTESEPTPDSSSWDIYLED